LFVHPKPALAWKGGSCARYSYLFVVRIAQIKEDLGVNQALGHTSLASSWVGFLLLYFFDLLSDLFNDFLFHRLPMRGRAAVSSSATDPLPFTILSETIVSVVLGILDTNIVIVLFVPGISARRRRYGNHFPGWIGSWRPIVIFIVVMVSLSIKGI